jgi:hypothetical protein
MTPGAARGDDALDLLEEVTEQMRATTIRGAVSKRSQQDGTPQSAARWWRAGSRGRLASDDPPR